MERADSALALFSQGFNCAQAVAGAYGDEFGGDPQLVLRASAALGGGISRSGLTCGAVVGALMVLGMRFGATEGGDAAGKERTYVLGTEFIRRFRDAHGSELCRDLIGCDLGTPEGMQQAKERDAHHKVCPAFVEGAVHILEGILDEQAAGA